MRRQGKVQVCNNGRRKGEDGNRGCCGGRGGPGSFKIKATITQPNTIAPFTPPQLMSKHSLIHLLLSHIFPGRRAPGRNQGFVKVSQVGGVSRKYPDSGPVRRGIPWTCDPCKISATASIHTDHQPSSPVSPASFIIMLFKCSYPKPQIVLSPMLLSPTQPPLTWFPDNIVMWALIHPHVSSSPSPPDLAMITARMFLPGVHSGEMQTGVTASCRG